MTREAAVAFLSAAPQFHLCGVGPDGAPVIKSLDGVVIDDRVCFHSSPVGEKTSLVGRSVVVNAEEVVAFIPSTFTDSGLACPATTLFRSVQVHGVLEALEAPELKAKVLGALMKKRQPEGGYARITPEHPGYAPAIKGILVAGVSLSRLDGKAKLAQNRSAPEKARLVERLWARGDANDLRAIELIREANPDFELPGFLAAPARGALHTWLPTSRVDEAVELVAEEYWNVGRFSRETVRQAHLSSDAWIGATDETGRLIATARAISDRSKHAWIYDVGVASHRRRQGFGRALLRLLLEHPAVRGCRRVLLSTSTPAFYEPLGFLPRSREPARSFTSTELLLPREGA